MARRRSSRKQKQASTTQPFTPQTPESSSPTAEVSGSEVPAIARAGEKEQQPSAQLEAARSDAIATLQADFAQLRTDLDALRDASDRWSSLTGLQTEVATLQARMTEIVGEAPDAIQFNTEAVVILERQVAELSQHLSDLADTREALVQLRAEFAQLQQREEPQAASAPADIARLRSDLDALQQRLSQPSEIEAQLEQLSTSIYGLQSTVTPLEQQLPEAIRYNTQSLVSLQERLEVLEQKQAANDAKEDGVTGEAIAQLQSQLSRLEEQLETLDRGIQHDTAAIASTREELAQMGNSFNTKVEQQGAAIERLQMDMSGLQAAIASKSEAADREEVARSLLELSSEFSRLKEQLPEALRYNTQSIVSLQSLISDLETRVESGNIAGNVEDLKAEIEILRQQQRWFRLGLLSSLGVAIAALAAATSQFLQPPIL
ncbi:hypothetical protein [Synechococcus sp. PCC 7336]|uniref:hypothetical protein n=1 Tax=Synechococcus sp. PCC 7336 TaxID=195250 RepID=UPI000344B74D|nr:hypothetical protein [Synechococcus sp. PCC 7336]